MNECCSTLLLMEPSHPDNSFSGWDLGGGGLKRLSFAREMLDFKKWINNINLKVL